MRDQDEIIDSVIHKYEDQLEEAKMNAWFYEAEAVKPKKVGKNIALERVGLYQNHVKSLTNQIEILYEYRRFCAGNRPERA